MPHFIYILIIGEDHTSAPGVTPAGAIATPKNPLMKNTSTLSKSTQNTEGKLPIDFGVNPSSGPGATLESPKK